MAVKMIVERERRIREFKPEEYWLIPAIFTTDLKQDYSAHWQQFINSANSGDKGPTVAEQNKWLQQHNAFKAELYKINDEKKQVSDGVRANEILAALKTAEFKVSQLTVKSVASRSSAPFITSTLQQAAANRLGFTTKKTMMVAQQLYEGIDLGSMGALGLITYMRTDSTHLSTEAVDSVRTYISRNIGINYLPSKPNIFTSKKAAQQAHEAIRPTDTDLTP
ncbi:unnamed protein product, partial [marine sediment metagenome]